MLKMTEFFLINLNLLFIYKKINRNNNNKNNQNNKSNQNKLP